MYKPHVYAITTKQHGQGFSDNLIALFYIIISNVPIRLHGFHSDLLVLLFSQEDYISCCGNTVHVQNYFGKVLATLTIERLK